MAKGKNAQASSEKVNKSKAIKDYLQEHPEAGAKEVSEALKAKGIDVPANYVSSIQYNMRGGGKKRKNGEPTVSDFTVAATLAGECGGIPKIKDALAIAAKVTEKFDGDIGRAQKTFEAVEQLIPNLVAAANKQNENENENGNEG